MTSKVHVYLIDGVPTAVYSSIEKMVGGTPSGREFVSLPLDPPVEEVYRVDVLFDAQHLKWEAKPSELGGHTLNERFWGKAIKGDYFCWFVMAVSPEQAIGLAKGLFREMI